MVKALFDTNILIDYLNGIDLAEQELLLYESISISVITWMEVMAGTNEKTEAKTRDWLKTMFNIISLDEAISDQSVVIRKSYKIKLPDAIIYATAQQQECLLISRNTKDFSADDPMVRVPYEL
ncbi:MAG: type II toxin-antitoxin system VapC family toxin [gamma proteobacterium symbiont of Taylorina sp.]|nr:type II toxin-antitoxin system VapC family toxin [gamma proteobacterium symbiont of Taylorina sp.]